MATQLCNIEQQYDDVRLFWLHKEIVTLLLWLLLLASFMTRMGDEGGRLWLQQ